MAASAALAAEVVSGATARADNIVDQIRAAAERDVGAGTITAGYAAFIDFAVSDDISANTYFVGNGELDVDVYKLPLPFTLFRTRNNWRVFGQATFGYINARQDIPSLGPGVPNEQIKSTWRAYAISLGLGVEIPITKRLYVEPFVFIGYSRLKNDATYSGPVSENLFQPALDGLLFNWSLDAIAYGGSIAVGYKFAVRRLDVNLRARISRTEIQAYHINGDFATFHTSLTTIRSEAELAHPLPIALYGRHLSLVALLANTTFVGPDADALGFTYYFETGLALQLDLKGYNLPITRLRLGANGVWGNNIIGYSIILNASF